MKVLVIEPGMSPEVRDIENTLEAKQQIVGGLIQMLCPPSHPDDAVIICNDEGKLLNMEPNRYVRLEDGTPYDVIAGPMIILRAPFDSEDFSELTDEQIKTYYRMYS